MLSDFPVPDEADRVRGMLQGHHRGVLSIRPEALRGFLIVTPEVMNKGLRTQRVSQFDQLSVGDVFAALS